MVAGRGEGIGDTVQHTHIRVEHGAGLAVQQFRRTVDCRPEGHPIAWCPRHTPSNGVRAAAQARTKPMEAPARQACPGQGTAARRRTRWPQQRSRPARPAGVVVAPDSSLNPELTQVLNQVEHEAVIVVDDQDLHA